MQVGIGLRQSGQTDTIQGGGHVLEAIAHGGGADVHDDVLRVDGETLEHDVQLLGEVDVVGGLSAHLLAVSQGDGSTDGLVVLVPGGQNQNVLALQRLSDLAEQLAVLLDVLAAHDHDGHSGSLGDSLGVGHTVGNGAVGTVGVCGLKVQAQEIRAGHGLSLLGEVDHGGAAGIEFLQSGSIPLCCQIGNLNTDLGRVFDGSIEGVKRHHILTADDDCLVTGAQRHGIDLAAEGCRFGSESHNL